LQELKNQAKFGRTKNILGDEIQKVENEITKLKDIQSLQKDNNTRTRKTVSEITVRGLINFYHF
jgi:predicted  nucleic acid-binding Zn-ribbon protein